MISHQASATIAKIKGVSPVSSPKDKDQVNGDRDLEKFSQATNNFGSKPQDVELTTAANWQQAKSETILIVDDTPDNLLVLFSYLEEQGFKVLLAENGKTALEIAQSKAPDLILLDVFMPKMDGFETCRRLKAKPATREIPVIFLTALSETVNKVQGFKLGGVDYITKPSEQEEILVRIKTHLNLRNMRQTLTARNKELQQEIRDRQKAEEQLVSDALHDSLTGLPNRTLLMERIDFAIQHSKRNPNYLFALLFIDLDHFKTINDSLGHLVGDKLLIEIAKILPEGLRATDTVARLGGDEFIILLEDIHDLTDATKVCNRLQKRLGSHFNLAGQIICTSASMGIALSATGYQNSSQILRDADIAMYRAKEKGKARYEVFDQAMYLQTLKTIELERNLRCALKHDELKLYYQPIISLKTGILTGFEALIRWKHSQQGFISPADFIPIAEDTGLIIPIGNWILRQACEQLSVWQQKFASIPQVAALKMSVNLASQQIREAKFIEKLDQILEKTGLDGNYLRLELTERVLIDSEQNTQNTLAEIKRRNIKLSIDYFGTGYSSLSYLRRLPIDNLKIDRSFIDNINIDRLNCNTESFEIVKTIITLAHTLGMDAIAEGVETIEQANQLRTLGCEYAQGYLFAKPLPAKSIESILHQRGNQDSKIKLAV